VADDRPATPVAELVKRARKGEPAAFDELVRRHLRAAYAVALAVLGRPADADDIAQDAFLIALEKLDDCRDPARFSGWLVQIVRTRALHALDKRKLRDPSDDAADAPSHAAPGDVVLRRQLLAALATLTPVQREVVLLHDLDDWTHAEIADALGLTETNCRQHLFTARRALRGVLGGGPNEV
jgi:RNA polymerase sigma-70 factor (ECF subfamily)